MTATPLPAWPEKPPIFHEVGELDDCKGDPSCSVCHQYDRDVAAAYRARLKVAVEALRYIDQELCVHDIGSLASQALAAIGPLPAGEV